MIKERLENIINDQIVEELYSAYLYLAMSKYAEAKGLLGVANWLYVQYQEETFHAHKFIDYVVERAGNLRLGVIAAPASEYGSMLELFNQVLKHEQSISSKINDIYGTALEEKDYAATIFLQWFVNEQVEEEASASAVVDKFKLAEGKQEAILFIDAELAKRQFVPPTANN